MYVLKYINSTVVHYIYKTILLIPYVYIYIFLRCKVLGKFNVHLRKGYGKLGCVYDCIRFKLCVCDCVCACVSACVCALDCVYLSIASKTCFGVDR